MAKSNYPGAVPVDKNDAYIVRSQLMNILQNLGMSKAIGLVEEASKNSDGHYYLRFMFKVIKTGKIYNTLEEAINAVKASATGLGRSRERNIDSNATPVSITKRNPQGYSWESGKRASGDFETSLSMEGNLRNSSMTGKKKRGSSKKIRHSDVLEFVESQSENELEHYGVLGMKWGVRKNPQRAYDKANKKLAKLEDRVNRSKQTVSKLQEKILRRQERANDALVFKKYKAKRAAKSTRKLGEAYTRVQKRTAKAKKWYDSMSDAFKDVKVSELKTNSTSVELGKKYASMTIDSMMNNSASAASMMQLAVYYENRSRR